VLEGSDRPFIVTSGLGLLPKGPLANEKDVPPPPGPTSLPRVSEETAATFEGRGVRSLVVRLSQIHDPVKQGLVPYLTALAREKGISAYIGEGQNRWAAAHISDTARLYRLALEKQETGARYHAVAEEGVPLKDIAEAIGRGLKIPVVSKSPDEAAAHFGWLARFAAMNLTASSTLTQQELGWHPTGPGLIADLDTMQY
jgi:nucleoside-diphosphate-sugar epimerase